MNISLEERRKRFNIPNDPVLAKNKTLALNVIAPERKQRTIHAYVRVSTMKQKIEGQSLEAQQDLIRSHCHRFNLTDPIEWYIEDAISGRSADRVEFNRMYSSVNMGDIIITYSLSRLGRNMHQMLDLIRDMKNKYVQVICLKENIDLDGPYANILLSTFATMAEMESDLVRERTKDAMQHLKEKGELRTKPKFGFKYIKDGRDTIIVEVEDEQKVINFILSLITGNPTISNAEITRAVNHEIHIGNLKYRNKPKVHDCSIRSIIINNNLRGDSVSSS